MPFCPQCGYQYREGASVCPDCNQPLTAQAPNEPRRTTAGWAPADQPPKEKAPRLPDGYLLSYEAPNPVLSAAVADALQGAGIPVEQVALPLAAGYAPPEGGAAFQHSLLLVPEARAEEAKAIVGETLAAYNQGNLALTQQEIAQMPAGQDTMPPHRGTAILVLGILGLVLFGTIIMGLVFGILAWVLGGHDLREMKQGAMNRSGEGLTTAGRVCGIVAIALSTLWLLLALVCALLLAVSFSRGT